MLGLCLIIIIYYAGPPQPVDVQGLPSNTSVALQWELPEGVQMGESYFNVSFTISHMYICTSKLLLEPTWYIQ